MRFSFSKIPSLDGFSNRQSRIASLYSNTRTKAPEAGSRNQTYLLGWAKNKTHRPKHRWLTDGPCATGLRFYFPNTLLHFSAFRALCVHKQTPHTNQKIQSATSENVWLGSSSSIVTWFSLIITIIIHCPGSTHALNSPPCGSFYFAKGSDWSVSCVCLPFPLAKCTLVVV